MWIEETNPRPPYYKLYYHRETGELWEWMSTHQKGKGHVKNFFLRPYGYRGTEINGKMLYLKGWILTSTQLKKLFKGIG